MTATSGPLVHSLRLRALPHAAFHQTAYVVQAAGDPPGPRCPRRPAPDHNDAGRRQPQTYSHPSHSPWVSCELMAQVQRLTHIRWNRTHCGRPYSPLQLAEPVVPTNVPTELAALASWASDLEPLYGIEP